ncbi:hypothetical protein H5V43_01775 [Sphingobium fuliginis]|jgi:hypothetical protein|uniref:Uncharacterized protein n=1 Tax=Sphingobium fuliginis (strain ATCC 27551) TaxID=336203 RepID=A0A7M2GGV5_SPHSA|nr:hypothetical protein [Sphingobium fuliginis]QOT71931.1 hypothetical protein H5V43_01775 [Sphingobium fuliginis]
MTDKAPVTVGQGDVVLRKAILTFIVEEIGKPCSEGDMPDDRNDRLDAIIAAHRLQSTAALEEEIKRLREALTPSGSTKAAYHGEFSFNLHRIDDCGDEYVEKVYVPWDTVKQIMKAILARTALEGRGS